MAPTRCREADPRGLTLIAVAALSFGIGLRLLPLTWLSVGAFLSFRSRLPPEPNDETLIAPSGVSIENSGTQPGGNGRGREPLSMATNVNTASVTLICSSPSRERRHASTWNFMDVRPVEIKSA